MSKGLYNLGNTCYLNAAVQCLAHVPELSNSFLRNGAYDGPCELTKEYSLLVRRLWNKRITEPIAPREFVKCFTEKFPQFTPGRQHDTHEAVLCLIDALEKSLSLDYMKKLFYGKEEQIVTYPEGVSRQMNEFMSLYIDDLNTYSKHVIIDNYEDDSGNKYNVAAIQNVIKHTPHCLTVIFGQKCPSETIPEIFQGMALFGLVVHAGVSHGGHYAAFLKHRKQWRLFDDDTVHLVDKPSALCSMAWYKKNVE